MYSKSKEKPLVTFSEIIFEDFKFQTHSVKAAPRSAEFSQILNFIHLLISNKHCAVAELVHNSKVEL